MTKKWNSQGYLYIYIYAGVYIHMQSVYTVMNYQQRWIQYSRYFFVQAYDIIFVFFFSVKKLKIIVIYNKKVNNSRLNKKTNIFTLFIYNVAEVNIRVTLYAPQVGLISPAFPHLRGMRFTHKENKKLYKKILYSNVDGNR